MHMNNMAVSNVDETRTNTYVLENEREFARLEEQGRARGYECEIELIANPVPRGGWILDAGCGSGIASRFLATTYPLAQVFGVDASEDRLFHAIQSARDFHNILFRPGDVKRLDFSDKTFDLITCRYVLHHMSNLDSIRAIREFYRCLKPGGRIVIIEPDGIFNNLTPQTELVQKVLAIINQSGIVDLWMGRKLTGFLGSAGFQIDDRRNQLLDFRNDLLAQEITLMEQRLDQLLPFLADMLKSSGVFPATKNFQELAMNFKDSFLSTLAAPESTYFHNKFIVVATKSGVPTRKEDTTSQ